jgi:flagellar hook-associated protein 2
MSSFIRIGGLATGMDIDKLVSDLMRAERTRVDSLYQRKQILQWQQQAYRELNSRLLSFRNTVADMKLEATVLKYSTSVSNSAAVTVSAGSAAIEGSYTLMIDQLAAQATKESAGSLSKAIEGRYIDDSVSITAVNNEFIMTVDGMSKTITLNQQDYSVDQLAQHLQALVDASFGTGRIVVGHVFDGAGRNRITFEPAGEHRPQIELGSGDKDALDTMGFSDGDFFRIRVAESLKDIAGRFNNEPFKDGQTI